MTKQHRRIRVSFQHKDDRFIYVTDMDGSVETIYRIDYKNKLVNEAFAETIAELWTGAQLNLLDVKVDADGILIPTFIVLEPDYLLDISTLAECFSVYGHHPANYLLHRLTSVENAGPLLLGNLANLFLDEWIYAEKEADYSGAMKKAFRRYALELSTCADLQQADTERKFFADCKHHFKHIRHTVNHTFRYPSYGLDRADAVLEPSYICEALGLQGRLDYMQRDMSAFIEMKSGKADEYSCSPNIVPRENNATQMLLYQAVLHYTMGVDHSQTKAYLFYTRYPLIYPSYSSWTQVQTAINLRNRIVATEYNIQLHNNPEYTAQKLADINPDVLNERHISGTFWNNYLQPAISLMAERISTLSAEERSYFYTLYTFITKELYTAKAGETIYEGRTGAATLWLSPFVDKLETGEILFDMTISESHADDERRPYLIFDLPQSAFDPETAVTLPNFRSGDAVILYSRNTETDNVTNQMVFKGNIETINRHSLRMRLRAGQHNAAVLPLHHKYAIEHDVMDSTFHTMYAGLAAFLTARPERRQLLLGQRLPEVDDRCAVQLSAEMEDLERIVAKACAARDYFLLVGPPGTGKTSFALRRMVEAMYAEGANILLLSYTNRAVDEICKALTRISPEVEFIRVGNELSCDPAYRPYLLENVLEPCTCRADVVRRLKNCRIYVGTVATLSGKPELFRLKHFDVAIIDEATQILEPQLVGLLSRCTPEGANAIDKFILIGDYKQLPAVVLQTEEQTKVSDPLLRALGITNLKDSLFQRLYRQLRSRDAGGDSLHYDMLNRQGRMHPEVAYFANHYFYGGALCSLGLPHQLDDSHPVRLCFYPSKPEPATASPKNNHDEARIACQLARMIYDETSAFDPQRTLGIITPYRSQIALIKQCISQLGIDALNEILVDTVERFQGSERDVIIYSFCVNRAEQLQYLVNLAEDDDVQVDRKLNVALTRARKRMFFIGVEELLCMNPIYKKLVRYVQNR